jgi:PAS domain S-box-containing protein
VEYEFVRKDGTVLPVLLNSTAIRDDAGNYLASRSTLFDSTELKRSEKALHESTELLRLLVENAVDYALIILDPNGNIVTWNLGAQRIKGYHAEEIVGKHFTCFYPTEMVERGWPELELKNASAEGRFEDESWRIRKDGTRFWASVIITALRDETGQLHCQPLCASLPRPECQPTPPYVPAYYPTVPKKHCRPVGVR